MEINYTLVATWTYFSLYVCVFIGTSIYCAIEVNNHNKKKQNCGSITITPNETNTVNLANEDQLHHAKYFIQQTLIRNANASNPITSSEMVQFLSKKSYPKSSIALAFDQLSISIPPELQQSTHHTTNINKPVEMDQLQNTTLTKIQSEHAHIKSQQKHTNTQYSIDEEETKYESTHSSIDIKNDDLHSSRTNNLQDDDAKDNKSIIWPSIKLWAKLLWQKKKVYFALLPHFFDQATDLGVILEYHRYNQEGNDIGIDTHYLFWVSISILIFHRVISSIAILLLSKSKLDALLQMVDVLTVKCVWINHILETDEPSNPQRYLQVFEAIFESSPQILLTTAFIVRTTTTKSPIVYVSLFTSMWSLCDRVASDDKKTFAEIWRAMFLDHKWVWNKLDGIWEQGEKLDTFNPKRINWRWFFRVFGFRFLEISSRICLFTLIWLNLGGFSVFVILSAEMFYVVMLCAVHRKIDMMGNLMYITAPGLNQIQGYRGAMLVGFWLYRVISSYIYLILVTVFALLKFNASRIEDYNDRYRVTFIDRAGLAAFIFCWASMPTWQVVGASIMKIGKRASGDTVRDIDLLCKKKQWIDAMELLSFGVSFEKAGGDILHWILNEATDKQRKYLIKICISKIKRQNLANVIYLDSWKKGRIKCVENLLQNGLVTLNADHWDHSWVHYLRENIKKIPQKEMRSVIENGEFDPQEILKILITSLYTDGEEMVTTRSGQARIIEWILLNCSDKIDVSVTSADGVSFLFHEAAKNNAAAVKIMINDYKEDCNVTDEKGRSLIQYILQHMDWRNDEDIKFEMFQTIIRDGQYDPKEVFDILFKSLTVNEISNEKLDWILENCSDKIDLTATSTDGIPLLFFQAARNSMKSFKLMINEYKVDCSVKDKKGRSLMQYFFENKHLRDGKNIKLGMVQSMIENGQYDPQQIVAELFEGLPINEISRSHIKEIFNWVLDVCHDKIDLRVSSADGILLLFEQAAKQNLTAVKQIINKYNIVISGKTGELLIKYIAKNSNITAQLISIFMNDGKYDPQQAFDALLRMTNDFGNDALIWIVDNHADKIDLSTTSTSDGSPLVFHLAAKNDIERTNTLVNECKVDCNVKDKNGNSVFDFIIQHCDWRYEPVKIEIMKILIEDGKYEAQDALANLVNLIHRENGAVGWILENYKHRIDLNAKDFNGIPLFFYIIANNDVEWVNEMVNGLNVDFNLKDKSGNSVIAFVSENGFLREYEGIKPEIVEMVIENGKFDAQEALQDLVKSAYIDHDAINWILDKYQNTIDLNAKIMDDMPDDMAINRPLIHFIAGSHNFDLFKRVMDEYKLEHDANMSSIWRYVSEGIQYIKIVKQESSIYQDQYEEKVEQVKETRGKIQKYLAEKYGIKCMDSDISQQTLEGFIKAGSYAGVNWLRKRYKYIDYNERSVEGRPLIFYAAGNCNYKLFEHMLKYQHEAISDLKDQCGQNIWEYVCQQVEYKQYYGLPGKRKEMRKEREEIRKYLNEKYNMDCGSI